MEVKTKMGEFVLPDLEGNPVVSKEMKLFVFEDLEGTYLIISESREDAKVGVLNSIYGFDEWESDLEGETLDFVNEYPLTYREAITL